MKRNKKKRKLTKFGEIVILLLIIILVFIVSKLFKKDIPDTKIINDYDNLNNMESNMDSKNNIDNKYITNNYESDFEIVNTYFADGMKLDDYNKLLNKKENIVKSTGKYKRIDYDFDRKLHYSEIESILKNLNNSDIVKLEIIGKSVDGRNIYGIEVGKGKDVVFIDANIHAAEVASVLFLTKFLNEIVDSYESGDKNIINSLNNIKLAIIPSINPDGYEVYNYGVDSLNNKDLWMYQKKNEYNFENIKSNANGVDINRNFPTQNAGLYYSSKKLIKNVSLDKTTSNTSYFGGYSLGSEPETRATMYFMLKHYKNTISYINMHSQGRVIYAGKPNLPNEFNNITISFANKLSTINNYRVLGLSSEEIGEGNDGSATDFMSELASGFKFSTKTLRLSTDKYINNSSTLKYSYPVITMETIKTYTRNPNVFKEEYYNQGIKEVLYSLLK